MRLGRGSKATYHDTKGPQLSHNTTIIPRPDIEQKPTTIVVDELPPELRLDGVKVVISVLPQEGGELSPAGAIRLAIEQLVRNHLTHAELQGIVAATSDLIAMYPRF